MSISQNRSVSPTTPFFPSDFFPSIFLSPFRRGAKSENRLQPLPLVETMFNFNEFQRAEVRRSNFNSKRTPSTPINRSNSPLLIRAFWRSSFLAASATLLGVFVAFGCASTGSDKSSCLFSPKKNAEAESLSSRKEQDVINRASLSTAGAMKGTWEPTEEEILAARNKGIDLKKFSWSAQQPNGAVLFPKKLPSPGPVVVLEPKTLAAPIGSEIVLVASFVGEDSTYLRVGEKLEWNVTGVGTFLASNPSNALCSLNSTSKKIDDRYLTTETTNKLWRVHRGTSSQLDDITILRGQSWASLESNDEGTSSIVVFANEIDNWERRKATAEIYWIDAAFRFPETSVSPLRTTQTLTTTVCRLSNADPRPGWPVRYQILSGNAGLGPDRERVLEVPTDANGNASVSLTENTGQGGTCKISATVLRPATSSEKAVVVDQRTFYHTWTKSAAITLDLKIPQTAALNEDLPCVLNVTNYSDFQQTAVVEMIVPSATALVQADPKTTDAQGSRVSWTIRGLESRNSFPINLTLRRIGEGAFAPTVRLVSSAPTNPDAYQSAPPNAAASDPALGTTPPVVSPTPGGSPAAPAPNGTAPPAVSPSTVDPASQRPSLGSAVPNRFENDVYSELNSLNALNGSVASNGDLDRRAEIANAGSRTFETTAFRFPAPPDFDVSARKPTVAAPFDARFSLTNPTKRSENIVVKIVANAGLELLVDGTARTELVYPARPLDEIADVVFKTRVVADVPGTRSLFFYAYRENGDLLTADVLSFQVDGETTDAEIAKSSEIPKISDDSRSAERADDAETRTVARPETSVENEASANPAASSDAKSSGESFQKSTSDSVLTNESATVFPPKTLVVRTANGSGENAPSGAPFETTRKTARVGETFRYRPIVRNFEAFALSSDSLFVEVELPDELAFVGPNGSADNSRKNEIFRLPQPLKAGGELELSVDLTPKKAGKTNLLFRITNAKNGAILGTASHPIEIVDAEADAPTAK